MNKLFLAIFTASLLSFFSCVDHNPNLGEQGKDELKALELGRTIGTEEQKFHNIIYVPIYSDIYTDHLNQKILLAATLSIRNTSYKDSLLISKIELSSYLLYL